MKTFFFWKTPKARFFKVVVEHQIKKAPSPSHEALASADVSLAFAELVIEANGGRLDWRKAKESCNTSPFYHGRRSKRMNAPALPLLLMLVTAEVVLRISLPLV